jgi:hypothetical protein
MRDDLLALYIGYMDKVLSNARVDHLRKLKRIRDHEVLPGDLPDTTYIQDIQTCETLSLEQLASDVSLQTALNSLSGNETYVLFQVICMERSAMAVAGRALRKLRNTLIGEPTND